MTRVKAMDDKLIILIAPNVSEQMGGEAIKALQIFQQYKKIHANTIQITHERNRVELESRLKLNDVFFIKDNFVSIFLWKSIVLRILLDVWFSKKSVEMAENIAAQRNFGNDYVIIHQTEPNSPVAPRSISKKHINVFGPINGNIYYPKIFQHKEKILAKFRRVLHFPLQKLNSLFFKNLSNSDLIFVAGGSRTLNSLEAGGCAKRIFIETLDCGINDDILDRPRIKHKGVNYKYIHFGRLVFHKCTFLIISSLVKTRYPVTLDIVGSGPELESCKQLVKDLGLDDRVRFLGWYTSHNDLFNSFNQYRGVVLPSIEDANGIVIQEAMAVGLPPICLDWGGPQLLIDHNVNGYLIEPKSIDYITTEMAAHLDKLGSDDSLAENFSVAGREKAENWRWSKVANNWISYYETIKKDA
ncbi:MAG: glycosyltransferase [Pseudomonadota bacterium]